MHVKRRLFEYHPCFYYIFDMFQHHPHVTFFEKKSHRLFFTRLFVDYHLRIIARSRLQMSGDMNAAAQSIAPITALLNEVAASKTQVTQAHAVSSQRYASVIIIIGHQ